ncbi:acyltransferase family protein [Butyrivibrio fibrisolvens]|uniref:acyltransferase family protein n=1 Tax=Butyrivibrio fibrisolvens TaxID=831 RepID=UPI00041D0A37|nr:acyltransferase [Butyrivibrio fibrisolvens]
MTKRNSSLELLRLLCVYGIYVMHTFGPFRQSGIMANYIFGLVENSVFNMSSTLFMLISGYFGLFRPKDVDKFRANKLIKIWLLVIFYGFLNYFLYLNKYWGTLDFPMELRSIVQIIFPISTNSWWFMTSYVIILCFARYIERAIRSLSKQDYEKVVCILFFFFYISPTFLGIEILDDRGKGIINMFTVYLIGRYISIYETDDIDRIKLIKLVISCITVEIILNHLCSVVIKNGVLTTPFARDNSIFVLGGAIAVFILFKKKSFLSISINKLSTCCFGAILFEEGAQIILEHFVKIETYSSENGFWSMVLGFAFLKMCIGIFVEAVRKVTISRCFETSLCDFIYGSMNSMRMLMAKRIDTFLGFFINH